MAAQVALLLTAAWLLTSALLLAGWVVFRLRSTITLRVRVRQVEIEGEEYYEATTDACGGIKRVARDWRRAVGGALISVGQRAEEL